MARQSKKASAPPPRLFRLRIELEGITPLILRQVWIGGEVTLHKLHHVIQAAMGWTDAHLHEFEIGGGSYGIPEIDSDFAPERPIINPPIFGYVEAGENACPPEDSGGIPGYQGFLDAWAGGKKSEEVREFLDWAGEDFDPARFDRHAANAALERMAWNRWV